MEAAQREAIRFVGEVLKGEPHRLMERQLRVNVHDEERSISFSVVVSLVITHP